MGRIRDEVEEEYHAKEMVEKSERYAKKKAQLRIALVALRDITTSYEVANGLSKAVDNFEKELLFWEKQNAIYLRK